MPPPIVFVPDSVFPKSALPNVFFLGTFAICTDTLGNVFFEFPPTPGKIVVVFRQLPEAMKVIGQNDYRIYSKGFGLLDMFEGFP